LNGTLGNGAGSNEPAWDCASGTGSLLYTPEDWVDYGTDAAWDIFYNTPWTVNAWVNPTTLERYGGVFGKVIDGLGGQYEFMLIVHDDGAMGFYTPSTGWRWSTTGIVSTGAWQLLSWVNDPAGTITYYHNGTAYGTNTFTSAEQTSYKVYTGAWLNNNYGFNGRIDNVSVFAEALDVSSVLDLYNKGTDGDPNSYPKQSSLTVRGLDTAQGYILDVNSNIVDTSAGLSCVPNSASFVAASGRGVSNDSTLFKFAGEGVDRTRIISRKPGIISNLSAQADRTITITTPGTLTIKYFQRVWDIDNSQWCYYTQTAINASPGTTDTQPNNSGNIISSSVVQILEIY